jgi:hypothetical protein
MEQLLSYYIVFHKKLFTNESHFTEEEQKVFTYVAVNESIKKTVPDFLATKKEKLLLEWELRYYNPLYQMNRLYQNSFFFHLVRHPQLLQKKYIGFGQYDQKINADSFRNVLALLQESPNILFGSFAYPLSTCFDVLTADIWFKMIVEQMNRVYNISPQITMEDLNKQPIFLLHTFIIPTLIFKEMMEFIEIYVFRQLIMALNWDTKHVAGSLERAIGIFLAICIQTGRFEKVVQYKVEQLDEQRMFDEARPQLGGIKEDPYNPFVETFFPDIDHNMDGDKAVHLIAPALPLMSQVVETKGRKNWLVTFGNERFSDSLIRINKEAEKFGLFHRIKTYNQVDLMKSELWEKHSNFITTSKKGYGYYIWKPYFVKHTLGRMNDNDILVWVDAGCTIHPAGKHRFLQYMDMVRRSMFGIIAFELNDTHLVEKTWTKMDTVEHFKMYHPRILETKQIMATVFMIRKCEQSMKLVDEWYQSTDHLFLYNDDPSKVPNDPSFKEHRSDQSVFSLLVKKYGADIIPDETYPPREGFPLLATRIRK